MSKSNYHFGDMLPMETKFELENHVKILITMLVMKVQIVLIKVYSH